jgi:hypothetical protein
MPEKHKVYEFGDTGFFRLQGMKVLWSPQFLGYLRTLSFKFQKATSKIEVVLSLTCRLSQFKLRQPTGQSQYNFFLVRAFWNFKFKVLKYSWICSLPNTLVKPLI